MRLIILVFVLIIVKHGSSLLDIPTREYASIITDIRGFYRENNCVFLLTSSEMGLSGHRVVGEVVRELSRRGVAGVSLSVGMMDQTARWCAGRPLNVILTSDQETRKALGLMEQLSSRPRWLMFVGDQPDSHFSEVYVPFDCEFLLAKRHNVVAIEPLYELYEVYRVGEDSPLTLKRFGQWSPGSGVVATNLTLRMRRNDMQGFEINVGAKNSWPALTIKEGKNNSTILGGHVGELWNSIKERVNFTTMVHRYDGLSKDFLPNGSTAGVFTMIERKQVQFSINLYSYVSNRLSVIDYLFPIYIGYQRVFIQSPSSINLKWNNFLAPFTLHLWVTILAFIFCLGAMLYIVETFGQRCQVHDNPAAHGLVESILFMHGFCCQQGQESTPEAMSGRIVYIIAALTSCILMAAYSAVLISFLSVQTIVFPVNNFQDMIKDGHYKLGMKTSSGFWSVFEESKDPLLQSVYSTLMFPGENNRPPTYEEAFDRICSDKYYSLLTSYEQIIGLWDKAPCAISPLPEISMPRTNTLVVAKNSPYKEIVNFYFIRMRQTGILGRSFSKSWPPAKAKENEDFNGVSLEQAIPIFTVYVCGLTLSLIVLTIEICVHKYLTHQPTTYKPNVKHPSETSEKVVDKVQSFLSV